MLEKNFIKLIRKNINFYSFYRIETTTLNGFPDLICVGLNMDTIFIETKIAKGNKINLSPFQISTNLKLWNESKSNYIIVHSSKYANNLPPNNVYLFEGRLSKELAINGLNEPSMANSWPTICSYFTLVHGSRTTKSPEISHE